MHEGCSGTFENGMQTVEKVRMMGFADQLMPMPFDIKCKECEKEFEMETFESKCPHCNMVYGVVPCHAFDPANVQAAGVDY
jgi:Zn finger protein HypA/HybF involved in hydrogenase expression